MKKWITVLLALLMCAALCAQAEKTPFTGYWELDSLEFDGSNVGVSELSFGVTLVIREDGTLLFALAEDQFVTELLTAEETSTGWRGRSTLSNMSPMYIDIMGRLCFTLNGDMVVRLNRSEPPGDPVVGEWTIDHAYKNGVLQSRDTLRDIGLTVAEDQFGLLNINGKYISVRLFMRDGELVVLRDDGHVYPATLGEDGQSLSLDVTTTEGSAWTLVLTRSEAAPEAEPESFLAAPGENPFQGLWSSVSASLRGKPVRLKVAVTLRIDGENGLLTMDGDTGRCAVTYDYDEEGRIVGCTISDNSDMTGRCIIGADGLLVMELDGDDGQVLLTMAQEAPEPAADPAPQSTAGAGIAPAASSGYDGEWVLTAVVMNGRSHIPADLGMEGVLRVTGESARYKVGAENTLGLVTTAEDGLVLHCRSGEYRFVLNEEGQLCQQTQSFGLTVTLCFTRQP